MSQRDQVAAVVGDGWCFRRGVRGMPAVWRHLFFGTADFFAILRSSGKPGVRTALLVFVLSTATVTAATVTLDALLTAMLARPGTRTYDPIGAEPLAWLELMLIAGAVLAAVIYPLATGFAAWLLRHRPSLRKMFVGTVYIGVYLQVATTLIVLCSVPLALLGGIRLIHIVYETINFLVGNRVTLQDPELHVYISLVFLWTVIAYPALAGAPAMYMTGIHPVKLYAVLFLTSLTIPALVLLVCFGVSVAY